MSEVAQRTFHASRASRFSAVVPFAGVLVVGILVSCWLGASGFPCPSVDDGAYKSPAAEWLQRGRMTVPCMKGFFPQAETVFACLPPIYQWLLAGWYFVFGFSLYSSLAFHYTVHLLGTAAVMAATYRLLEPTGRASPGIRNVMVAAVGLIYLANLTYFDRPEETALLWVWVEVLVVQRRWTRRGVLASALSGVFVGLAALTSPAIGVLGAIVVAVRAIFTAAGHPQPQRRAVWTRAAGQVGAAGVVAAGMAATWWAAMEVQYPGALRDQLFGTLQAMRANQMSGSLVSKLGIFLSVLWTNNRCQLAANLLALFAFPGYVAVAGWRRAAPMSLALYVAAVLGIIAVATMRPVAYTYLGASMMLLLPCLGPAVARYMQRSRRAGLGLLVPCVGLALLHVAWLGLLTFRLPPPERPRVAYARLAEIIPPGDSVAVVSVHWYPFQGRNPWRDAFLTGVLDTPEIDRFQWLVLPSYRPAPKHIEGFELVEEVPTDQDYCYTCAYRVWRRRER